MHVYGQNHSSFVKLDTVLIYQSEFIHIATCTAFSHHKTLATSELIVNNNDHNTSVSCGEEITNLDVIMIFIC